MSDLPDLPTDPNEPTLWDALNPPFVRLSNLRRSFKQGEETIEVLRGVNLDIRPGEIVARARPLRLGQINHAAGGWAARRRLHRQDRDRRH